MSSHIFNKFVNKYALSKTLRFELRPVGETLDNMRTHLKYDESLQTFMKDQEIEDAYQALKPVLDRLHEGFITESLELETAKSIDFSTYWKLYQQKKDVDEKEFAQTEKILRQMFDKAYKETGEAFCTRSGNLFDKKGPELLKEKEIFTYIRQHAEAFSELISPDKLYKALDAFNGFSVYFSGFHQNRENYYATKDEAATAVATRVVHENLPKYCDNMLVFTPRESEYVGAFEYLRSLGRELVTKEGRALVVIEGSWFLDVGLFNQCLSQSGIDTYNERVANANFIINLYNQARKEEEMFSRLPLLKKLFKQIGCGSVENAIFFQIVADTQDQLKDGKAEDGSIGASIEGVLLDINEAVKKVFIGSGTEGIVDTIPDFFTYLLERSNYTGVYISKVAMNSLSSRYFGDWQRLKDLLKDKKVFQKAAKDSDEAIKIPDAIELDGMFLVMDSMSDWRETLFKKSVLENPYQGVIIHKAKSPGEAILRFLQADVQTCIDGIKEGSAEILALQEYKTQEGKESIKRWMDQVLQVTQILKYFSVKPSKAKGMDSVVSEALDLILLRDQPVSWFGWYDALRNYLTRKPQDDIKKNKLKLNFENATLGQGWDVNKESDNLCALFESGNGTRFLGIIAKTKDKGWNKIFKKTEKNPLFGDSFDGWKKIEYKLLPNPHMQLPKCVLKKSDRAEYGATEEILRIYDSGSFKKNEEKFSRSDLKKMIDFYKEAIPRYEKWSCYTFDFKSSEAYEDISQFYHDVEKQGYKLGKVSICKEALYQYVADGKMYLFEIKNQDSNDGKLASHKQNLHTMYWEAIFQDIDNKPKLNGGVEIFYRRALSEGDQNKKRDRSGKEIIENFRFSKEKFLFHVPITLNPCAKDLQLNDLVQGEVGAREDVMFLGIDRGEKHLAYYSLVDKEGHIHDQGTLNMPFLDGAGNPRNVLAETRSLDKEGKEVVGKVICADYNELLSARAGDRAYARKNWQAINSIADLKNGYVSQVVKSIADLAIKHNAFIVLEDLGRAFNRGRQKIEKSVYQKLELALAKKLNFYVDKAASVDSVGSVTKALQLTPLVTNYQDIENKSQIGIMLYTRADYTSQTDPVTGWRKSIYLKRGSEESVKKQIVSKFKDISFDGKDFVFVYDQRDKDGKFLKEWKLYSGKNGASLDRYHREKDGSLDQWVPKKQDIHAMLKELFANTDEHRSIFTQLFDERVELKKIGDHTAWESLRFAIELIQQIRNTGKETDICDNDFLQSPVRRVEGAHFDSRLATEEEPSCGDANGAYNIARKGSMMNECLQMGLNPRIRYLEWDMWLADKNAWRAWAILNKQSKKGKKKTA